MYWVQNNVMPFNEWIKYNSLKNLILSSQREKNKLSEQERKSILQYLQVSDLNIHSFKSKLSCLNLSHS